LLLLLGLYQPEEYKVLDFLILDFLVYNSLEGARCGVEVFRGIMSFQPSVIASAFYHSVGSNVMSGLVHAPRPPVPPLQSLINVTAAAQNSLGMYCRVVVGDAKFRARLYSMILDRVYVWMQEHRRLLVLFGKRAWNAHLKDRTFAETTQDIDIFVYESSLFSPTCAELLRILHEEFASSVPYMNSYTKPHMDNRGKTFTVEICGNVLIDLSTRDIRGDFCINGETKEWKEDYAVDRAVEHSSRSSSSTISVLRRDIMVDMLQAETTGDHWRRDKAAADLKKYLVYEALGFFLLDSTHNSASLPRLESHVAAPPASRSPPEVDTSFQLPIMEKYIRHCSTLEECIRIVDNLFFWVEGDRVHDCVSKICAAKSLSDCRTIVSQACVEYSCSRTE
jgi:hypothetical protein